MVLLNLPDDVEISFRPEDLPRIEKWQESHQVKKMKAACPLCGGTGKIRDGHVTCPRCKGKGKGKARKSATPQLCAKCGTEIEKAYTASVPNAMLTKSLREVAESDADPAARENALRALAEVRTHQEYGSPLALASPAVSPTHQRITHAIPRTSAEIAAELVYDDDPRTRESAWASLNGGAGD
jgi:hypothetical protein